MTFSFLFFLHSQDRDGNPVDVQVKDNGNGTYSCSYTPRKPIKHTVMVSWGGVNIPESPFRVSLWKHCKNILYVCIEVKILQVFITNLCFCLMLLDSSFKPVDEYWSWMPS